MEPDFPITVARAAPASHRFPEHHGAVTVAQERMASKCARLNTYTDGRLLVTHLIPTDRLEARIIDPEVVCTAIGTLTATPDVERMAQVFALLSDPNRLRLLLCLQAVPGMCVSDLAVATGMADSAVSHALRLLRAQGVVSAHRTGRLVRYRLGDPVVDDLLGRTLRASGPADHHDAAACS
jgi:ArsR family transcriptional regulator, lead/cadmium/zinc/bismuth-responsive transcriptional repressor